jgi:hypothetical protein
MAISDIDGFVSGYHTVYPITKYGWAFGTTYAPSLSAYGMWSRTNAGNYQAYNCFGTLSSEQMGFSILPIGSPMLAGVALSGISTGTFTVPDPTPGKSKYVYGMTSLASNASVKLVDILLIASGFSNTTTGGWVDLNTIPIPARDATGGTNGYGVRAALCVGKSDATTSTAVNFSRGPAMVVYTNSDNMSPMTGYIYEPAATVSIQSSAILDFALSPGCKGVKSVQSIYFSTGTDRTFALVLYRPITDFHPLSNAGTYLGTISNLEHCGLVEIYSGSSFAFITNDSNQSALLCNCYLRLVEG